MTAPTEEKTAEASTESAAEGENGAGEKTAEVEKDWKAEFEAQQRINRDIERRNGKRLKELEAELSASKTQKPEGDSKGPDLDAIRQQILAETQAATLKDKVIDKIEAKAARLFKDPEDALLRLGKNPDEYITDGKIDVEAIQDALDDLLKKRPDFGVTQGDAKRFTGTADAGPKGSAGKPQLTDAQVKQMYKEGKTEEIEAARKAGQLNTLLGIKS